MTNVTIPIACTAAGQGQDVHRDYSATFSLSGPESATIPGRDWVHGKSNAWPFGGNPVDINLTPSNPTLTMSVPANAVKGGYTYKVDPQGCGSGAAGYEDEIEVVGGDGDPLPR